MNMKFRIAIQHIDEAVQMVTNLVKDYDVVVYDVREADIRDSNTEEKMGEVYILCCEASAYNYLKVKENLYTTEIEFEGFKTIM